MRLLSNSSRLNHLSTKMLKPSFKTVGRCLMIMLINFLFESQNLKKFVCESSSSLSVIVNLGAIESDCSSIPDPNK